MFKIRMSQIGTPVYPFSPGLAKHLQLKRRIGQMRSGKITSGSGAHGNLK